MLHAHFCTHGHILLARPFPPVIHLTSQTKMNLGLNPWWAHLIADACSRLSKGCGEKFQNESFFEGSPARYVLAMDERCACRVNTRGKTAQRSSIQISHIDAPCSLQILPIPPQNNVSVSDRFNFSIAGLSSTTEWSPQFYDFSLARTHTRKTDGSASFKEIG